MDSTELPSHVSWRQLDRLVARAFPMALLVGLYRAEQRLEASLPDWLRLIRERDLPHDDKTRAVDRMEHCWQCLRALRYELDKLHEHIEAMQSSQIDSAPDPEVRQDIWPGQLSCRELSRKAGELRTRPTQSDPLVAIEDPDLWA